jgi:hypothetical protein
VELVPGTPVMGTLKITDVATLCLGDKCTTLLPETPTLRGRWERPRTAELGKPETWPKGEIVRLDIAGPSYTWGIYTGADVGVDSAYGDEDDTVSLVGPDHYELSIGKRRFTATRLAGQRLEVCEAGKSCATLERGFNSDRTDVPCRE